MGSDRALAIDPRAPLPPIGLPLEPLPPDVDEPPGASPPAEHGRSTAWVLFGVVLGYVLAFAAIAFISLRFDLEVRRRGDCVAPPEVHP